MADDTWIDTEGEVRAKLHKELQDYENVNGSIFAGLERMGVRLDNLAVLIARVNYLVDQLVPPHRNDAGEIMSLERLSFEIGWMKHLGALLEATVEDAQQKRAEAAAQQIIKPPKGLFVPGQ